MINADNITLKTLSETIRSYFEKEEKEFLEILEKHPFYCESKYVSTKTNIEGTVHFINSSFDDTDLVDEVKELARRKLANINMKHFEFTTKVNWALKYIDTNQLTGEEMVKQVNRHADDFPDYFKNNVKEYYSAWEKDRNYHLERMNERMREKQIESSNYIAEEGQNLEI